MAHQMKNLCGFSLCSTVYKGHLVRHLGYPKKMKNAAPRDELKNGRGRGWAVPYVKIWNSIFLVDISDIFYFFLLGEAEGGV